MKKILLRFLVLLMFFSHDGFSQEIQEDGTTTTIEAYLDSAGKNLDRMNIDVAHKQLVQALKLSQDLGHKQFIAQTSGLLAQMYFVQHDYQKAEKEFLRAIKMQDNIEDRLGKANSLVNFSKLNNVKQDFEEANENLDEAEEIYEDLGDSENLGIVALNRAVVVLNSTKNLGRALHLLEKSEKLLSGGSNYYEQSRVYYYFARTFMHTQDLKRAEEAALKAIQIAEKYHYPSMQMSSNLMLSQILEEKGNFKASLIYLKESNSIRNTIFNLNQQAMALDANTRYGVDLLKNQMNVINEINREQERTLQFNKLTTILSVALITILSLLTLSLYKNNHLRARANSLLQKKNAELLLAKENAEKASLAKAQFLSTITHELRTPLYAVTGLTHLLLEESPTPNQKEHLNSLKFSGEYLLSLINNILDLNKLEAKKVETMDTSFNLKKRINDVLIALNKSGEDKGNKIHHEFDEAIPKRIKGDPLIISQILINLIGNAIKFTENGDIWIRVKLAKKTPDHVFLRFEVEDNGEGISKEKQNSIFENFTQGSMQINRKFGGTGLGLSIVKNLLDLLHSEIHLESDLGKGALFYFQLTLGYIDVPEKKKAKLESEVILSNEIMHHKRILIVEDNKINQMITRKILEKHKVICDVADNGSIAVEKVQNNKYDLVLMDIHMPGISGIEATIEIRKFNNNIPIIALTAVTLDDNLDQFYLNGFNDIIPKPYKVEEFFQKINNYLVKI
ncbi:MAG TPA: response regulator [Salinimicrobium sp.]|nr:response regulator [Salinimicrobium sp.]